MADCGRKAWLEDDPDDDNPCVCGLDAEHLGLHQCFEGCGSEWAGGMAPKPTDSETESETT